MSRRHLSGPARQPLIPLRVPYQVCSAERTDEKAISLQGISSHSNCLTSRLAGPATGFCQAGRKYNLHLTQPSDRINRQHTVDGNSRPRLFPSFAPRALTHSLAHFHIAGGDCPKSEAWINGAPAQQYTVTLRDDAPDHDLRILVSNEVTTGQTSRARLSPSRVRRTKRDMLQPPYAMLQVQLPTRS